MAKCGHLLWIEFSKWFSRITRKSCLFYVFSEAEPHSRAFLPVFVFYDRVENSGYLLLLKLSALVIKELLHVLLLAKGELILSKCVST